MPCDTTDQMRVYDTRTYYFNSKETMSPSGCLQKHVPPEAYHAGLYILRHYTLVYPRKKRFLNEQFSKIEFRPDT